MLAVGDDEQRLGHYRIFSRLCSKQPIARISETGHDIAAFVQSFVNSGGKNRDRRVFSADGADALRRGNQIYQADIARFLLGQQIQGSHRAASGREHRINQDDFEVSQIFRKTLVVKLRLQCCFLSSQPNKTDTGVRNQLQNGIQHPQTRAQHRDKNDLASQLKPLRPAPAGFERESF